ncbi:hypothetical protein AALP_AA8G144500 [Arabis alpina]|uniref:Uncharacterized protein n=1 Tax=Arabis alpina TaxID=50452 RepID=A0A087G720_ARAAL|nr:hypothetical protein AALP_AA8G144500 [Arabis alpina]
MRSVFPASSGRRRSCCVVLAIISGESSFWSTDSSSFLRDFDPIELGFVSFFDARTRSGGLLHTTEEEALFLPTSFSTSVFQSHLSPSSPSRSSGEIVLRRTCLYYECPSRSGETSSFLEETSPESEAEPPRVWSTNLDNEGTVLMPILIHSVNDTHLLQAYLLIFNTVPMASGELDFVDSITSSLPLDLCLYRAVFYPNKFPSSKRNW